MQDLQEIFNRVQENKKKKRDIQKSYTDAFKNIARYQEIQEEIRELREDKKMLENQVKQEYARELEMIDELKMDIDADTELLKDISINKLLKGEKIEIVDEYDNPYEPVFSVKFTKNN